MCNSPSQSIIAVSDTHCRMDVLNSIIQQEMEQQCTPSAILHCGDMGIFDNGSMDRLPDKEKHLITKHRDPIEMSYPYIDGTARFPLPLYFVPGNHEDFELVEQFESGERQIGHFRMCRSGERLQLAMGHDVVSVMGLGRILPPVISPRKRCEPKMIRDEDLAEARRSARNGRPDILLLHEPPLLSGAGGGRMFGSPEVTRLIRDLQPGIVLTGHLHFEYSTTIGNSRVYGLGYGLEGRYAVIDDTLEVRWKDLYGRQIQPRPVIEPSAERVAQLETRQRQVNAKARVGAVARGAPLRGSRRGKREFNPA